MPLASTAVELLSRGGEMCSGESDKCEELDGFYLVVAELDRQRPLNRFDGDYQRAVSVAGDQNSFDTVEASSTDPHVLTHFEEWAKRVWSINPQKSPDALYLFFWDGHALAPNSDETKYATYAEDFGPELRHEGHVQKRVTGKQRQLDKLSPVAPAVQFGYKR
jgi:hypothetical protein